VHQSKARPGVGQARRREQILSAAIPLFAANGFSNTGIADIARAAGVSFGSVHYYFGSKKALFCASVLEPAAELEAELAVPDVGQANPRTALEAMVQEHVALVVRRRMHLQLLQYVLSQSDRFPDLAEQIAIGPRFSERLEPLLQQGHVHGEVEPGSFLVTGTAYLAYLFGLSQVVLIDADSLLWEEYAQRGLRILGVRP